MWRASMLAVVIGCGGGTQPAPAPPDADNDPLETARLTILMCTSGLPGEPTCPLNTIGLDVADASMNFVAQSLGSGIYLTKVTFLGGTSGLHLENPTFLFWPDGADEPIPADPLALVLDIPPGQASAETSAGFVGQSGGQLSLRFDVLGPFE